VNNPLAPQKIENSEELFLAGQRIDQFHNPSLDAGPYWEELLNRDPGNIEANTGMGLLDLRCARYDSAEQHFRKAIKRLTFQYTTPKNAESFYYLGVVLKAQGRFDEAFTSFYKAAWSQEWKAPSYYSLAEIAASENDFERALKLINQSLDANANNIRAYSLKAAILRHLGKQEEALDLISFATPKTDPLDVRLMAEKWLITKDDKIAATLYTAMNSFQITAEETAAEYLNSGLWDDGVQVLTGMIISSKDKASINPLVYYYLGHFHEKLGNTSKASECRKQAALQSSEYVFPFQSELIVVLQRAIEMNPGDARAHYYMGNLLFDWQPDEAISHWGKAVSLEPQMTIALRNLSQAFSHKTGDENRARAISYMEKAVAVSNPCPTHFAELDRLYKSSGTPVSQRLAILEKNQQIVIKNDEALGSIINLKTFSGKADEAIMLMKNHIFSIWEGGNAFNTGQAWTDAHLVRGLKYFSIKKYTEALADFSMALTPPENLRAQQGRNYRQLQIAYWRGCAYEKLGEKDKAKQTWEDMVSPGSGSERPGQGDQKYFIALSHKKLGSTGTAEELFGELSGINTGTALRQPDNSGDPQFVAARRLPSRDNLAMPHYTTGLGYAGLGNKNKAREEFNAALAASPDFLSAKIALDLL
jgi:tetratricopeptide (TPR) repeat protein